MKFPSLALGAMLFVSALTVHAATSDDMQIYSGRFVNGWGDGWSWMTHYPTNNPVYTSNSVFVASNSVALVPSALSVVWWLKSGITVDATLYTNLTFWINGGATGGQNILVYGETNGSSSGLPSASVTAPTNAWKQVTISLASLGVNKTNLTGFQFKNNTSTNRFFIDDMRLIAAAKPATVQVSVNATQTVRTVSGRVFAINQVGWDENVNTPATKAILNDIGSTCLRWPGGSGGDVYHWTNEAWITGATSPQTGGSFSPDFIALATNTHSQAFIIMNYGSSTPEEAAFGVRMFNVTNHCNFKYWEIGNEINGTWETDYNTNAPYKAHDPWTYAMRFKDYYTQMKAVDPTIKIGAVIEPDEDGYANYTDHPVVNPRTGVTHNGWSAVLLTYMRSNNCTPDFVIEHKYGPSVGDTMSLLWSSSWTTDAANLRQMLNDYLGSAATNVTLECTEAGVNAGPTLQNVSLPGGLFYADNLGQVLQTEFQSRVWWDLRNGQGTVANPDPANYGWRTNANGSFLDDGGIVYGPGGVGSAYPKYYCAKLMPKFAAEGDTVVRATSSYPLLATYAVMRTNGTLTLLVINKSASSSLTANFNLSGYVPYGNAAIYSYGIPQDEAARTGVGSPDIAQTNFIGAAASFSATFAPFSATVLVMGLANQPPVTPTTLVATASNAVVSLSWNGSAGADSYLVKRSTTSGSGYVTIASGVNSPSYLDTGVVNGTTYYYVVAATNVYGGSSNSTEASATPIVKLTGTIIGSSGSWNNSGNTITNAFDGNLNTFYDAVNGTGDWAGLDLGGGAAPIVTQIKYCPRAGWATSRMVGGQFQGANVANFSSGVTTLFTVASTPSEGTMTVQAITNATAFRYLRYLGPANAYCDVAEVEFDGAYAVTIPAAPTSLVATASNAAVALSWNAASGADSYTVKRSPTSGSGYTNIASGVTVTSYLDTGVVNGTTYYYVVSATNSSGESPNSVEASATPGVTTNLLVNPGFEWNTASAVISTKITTGFDVAANDVAGWLNAGATFADSGVDFQGNNGNVAHGGTVFAYCDQGDSGAYQITSYPMNAGDQIQLTWWAKSSWGNAGQSVSLLRAAASSSDFASLAALATSTAALNNTLQGGAYTQYTLTYTAPAADAGKYLAVAFRAPGAAGAWAAFDDFSLTVAMAPANPVPPAPAGLAAVAGNAQVALVWNTSATATNYYVKRSTTSGSGYVTIATNASLAFTNTGLVNGTTYYYVVSAVNAGGESTNSMEASATPLAPPNAPVGIIAIAGDAQVALNWSAASTATGYKIKRSLTSGSGYVNIATNASLAFTNTGLTNGTLYYFVVSATNSFGESTNSTQVSARPTSAAPVAMNAANAAGQLQISWPADHTGWQLQSQTNNLTSGLGTNWVNVPASMQTNQMTVPINATNGSVFFRLVRP